jgi:hypothetical protein
MMARVLSSLMRSFGCRRVDVGKFEPDMSRTSYHDPQPKDAVNPDQVGLTGHAMRLTL